MVVLGRRLLCFADGLFRCVYSLGLICFVCLLVLLAICCCVCDLCLLLWFVIVLDAWVLCLGVSSIFACISWILVVWVGFSWFDFVLGVVGFVGYFGGWVYCCYGRAWVSVFCVTRVASVAVLILIDCVVKCLWDWFVLDR